MLNHLIEEDVAASGQWAVVKGSLLPFVFLESAGDLFICRFVVFCIGVFLILVLIEAMETTSQLSYFSAFGHDICLGPRPPL